MSANFGMIKKSLPPTIETTRLVLRRPKLSDALEIFRNYASDAEVTRYLTWKPDASVAEVRRIIRQILEAQALDAQLDWAITRRGKDSVIGMISLRFDKHRTEAGYVLAKSQWGRGYMTEALRAVVGFAFSLPNIYRVAAICDTENRASARVMEKAGMILEGQLRRFTIHPNISDEPRDVYCYAKTR